MALTITDYLSQTLPGRWLMRGYEHCLAYASTIALVLDAIIDGADDGALGAMPGQTQLPGIPSPGEFGSIDALPLIGRDRGIVQGPTESPADYAARLRAWRTTWRTAGGAMSLLQQLAGALAPNHPTIRLVTTGGLWYSLLADGTYVFNTTMGNGFRISPDGTSTPETGHAYAWDWDSLSGGNSNPFRVWAIIYAPTNPPLDGKDGSWGDGLSLYGENASVGTTATTSYIELIRAVVRNWLPAGIVLSHIIIAFDPSSFAPLAPPSTTGMPDGYWGNEGKVITVGGNRRRVSARNLTARYWLGDVQ